MCYKKGKPQRNGLVEQYTLQVANARLHLPTDVDSMISRRGRGCLSSFWMHNSHFLVGLRATYAHRDVRAHCTRAQNPPDDLRMAIR